MGEHIQLVRGEADSLAPRQRAREFAVEIDDRGGQGAVDAHFVRSKFLELGNGSTSALRT